MATPKRPLTPGRRVEANGRSKEDKGFVRFNHWMMRSAAFQALDPFETRVLLELYALYNGRNNGYLFLSHREAAKRCRMGKNKAGACLQRLTELGFIRRRADEPENFNLREATHWILAEFDFGKRGATKDFMSWQPPPSLEARPLSRTSCPSLGTTDSEAANENDKVSLMRDKNAG